MRLRIVYVQWVSPEVVLMSVYGQPLLSLCARSQSSRQIGGLLCLVDLAVISVGVRSSPSESDQRLERSQFFPSLPGLRLAWQPRWHSVVLVVAHPPFFHDLFAKLHHLTDSLFLTPVHVGAGRLQCGVNPVVVHGGGPQIAAMLKRLDIPTAFVEVSSPTMIVVGTECKMLGTRRVTRVSTFG